MLKRSHLIGCQKPTRDKGDTAFAHFIGVLIFTPSAGKKYFWILNIDDIHSHENIKCKASKQSKTYMAYVCTPNDDKWPYPPSWFDTLFVDSLVVRRNILFPRQMSNQAIVLIGQTVYLQDPKHVICPFRINTNIIIITAFVLIGQMMCFRVLKTRRLSNRDNSLIGRLAWKWYISSHDYWIHVIRINSRWWI